MACGLRPAFNPGSTVGERLSSSSDPARSAGFFIRYNLSAGQFQRQCWQLIILAFGKAECEHNVIAFDIACLLQALNKCAQTLRERCNRTKKSDHRHRRLLGACSGWRQKCCTTNYVA